MLAVTPWDGRETGPRPAGPPGPTAVCVLALGDRPALAALVRLRPDGGLDPAAALAERLAGPDPEAVAGVSAAAAEFTGLPAAWRQARAAARTARAERRFRPVARWDGLGPYRLLTGLPAAPADPAVAPLLRPAHRDLARTAESYLDHAGQAGRTAAALGIHRQTLYYRLSRVEQLTGLELTDGGHRLLLHMALKAVRLPAEH
jgi:sugar diacid utilization regulator